MTLLLLLSACKLTELLEDTTVPVPCDARAAFYADADGDGLGDAAEAAVACEAPEGYVAAAGDCDDADPAVGACDTGGTPTDSGTTPTDTGADTATRGD